MASRSTAVWRTGMAVGFLLAVPMTAVLAAVSPRFTAWLHEFSRRPTATAHEVMAHEAVAEAESRRPAPAIAQAAFNGKGQVGVDHEPVPMGPSHPVRPAFWTSNAAAQERDRPFTESTLAPDAYPGPDEYRPWQSDDASRHGPAGLPREFAWLEVQLRAMGARHYRLETWGARGELYRFQCLMEFASDANRGQHFEATEADARSAVGKVLGQMYEKLPLVNGKESARRLVGGRVRFIGKAGQAGGRACVQGDELVIYCDSSQWPVDAVGKRVETIGLLRTDRKHSADLMLQSMCFQILAAP